MADRRGLILNVDDYEAARYARTQMLKRAGFEVIEAGTGAESIRLASEQRPDLVLLDVNLPDMDGFEVCRRLRSQQDTLTVPIVHISATFVNDRAEEIAYEGGADSYLTDPVEPAVLLATIHSLLRLRRAEEGLRAAGREWQATFDAIGDGICLLTSEGAVVHCNAAFASLLDSAPADLVGRPWAASVARLAGGGESSPTARLQRSRRRETVELPRDGTGSACSSIPCSRATRSPASCASSPTSPSSGRSPRCAPRSLRASRRRGRTRRRATGPRTSSSPCSATSCATRSTSSRARCACSTRPRVPRTPRLPPTREVIDRQVRQLARLVDDLLDVGRVTTGKIGLVNGAGGHRRRGARAAWRALDARDRRPRRTSSTCAPRRPGSRRDQSRLEQIVDEPPVQRGQVHRRPAARSRSPSRATGDRAALRCSDTGVGIAPDCSSASSSSSSRASARSSARRAASASASRSCGGLVELHGGRRRAESPGPGPRQHVHGGAAASAGAGGRRGTAPPARAAAAPRRILIVEDNPDAARCAASARAPGPRGPRGGDGPSALEAALGVRPDVALLDVGLPGIDGYEVAPASPRDRRRPPSGWSRSPATACRRTTGARARPASTRTS